MLAPQSVPIFTGADVEALRAFALHMLESQRAGFLRRARDVIGQNLGMP